ncbi:MAG: hypothetical protein II049_03835, partial [Clostridia bacterium]|nr:hypothetical protein [Clostridia bacterium]
PRLSFPYPLFLFFADGQCPSLPFMGDIPVGTIIDRPSQIAIPSLPFMGYIPVGTIIDRPLQIAIPSLPFMGYIPVGTIIDRPLQIAITVPAVHGLYSCRDDHRSFASNCNNRPCRLQANCETHLNPTNP